MRCAPTDRTWDVLVADFVDVATGARTRITDDLAWDEHAHLSPDGRKRPGSRHADARRECRA